MADNQNENQYQFDPKEGVLIAVLHDKDENRFDLEKLEKLDNASPFDIMDSTNSVNGQQYAAKMPGFSHYNNLESLKYHAYIKEGDKLRPMTMKEVTTLPPKGGELPESYSQELFLLLRRRAS